MLWGEMGHRNHAVLMFEFISSDTLLFQNNTIRTLFFNLRISNEHT